ncbi:tRNA(Ile)-lysidine synthetase, variant 1 [Aphanomyces astaci]|uniref:tRNA(Ile)-lysidine synthetase n=1 Tax=Aphanomyces astaci TaxID=112090 RepID=W4G7H9_APHAT|nr:tRNA(Ile)-lysidine synthetase, variant 1 [Aphanomyces astaci]ETV75600.1 tRNA(Ile)-lysidine synthetase, variant 1 [Aphanomyces astaci]|eukprot:XP_009834733.1 tRNA(Ile)-lysidine synthetase, variant 1 [Aphanomyces astaci]
MAGLSQVTAVTASAFRQLMESIPKTHRSGRVAIALSGGADSTALLMLLREYVVHPNQVLAVTVDHGLRPESADEARHVASFATKYNIPHQIHRLRWDDIPGKLPRSQLQIQARLRRYSILGDVCTREGIHGLYVGHHLGDQLETLLFRLGRGSGWSGLAGMPAWSLFPVPHPTFSRDLHVVRPLLAVNKAQLKATCNRFGQEWVEDPSNDSEDFDRIRIRKQVRALGALPGSDALEHGLALLQQHAREAHDDLQLAVELLDSFLDDPLMFDELAIRVLTGIVRDVGGKAYPPRVSSVALLLASLQHKTLKRSTTLGGCLVRKKRGCVAFEPEVPQHTLHTTLP